MGIKLLKIKKKNSRYTAKPFFKISQNYYVFASQ